MTCHQGRAMDGVITDRDSGLEARYANHFKVGYNATEFLFEFGQFHTGSDLKWISRIVIHPSFAKDLQRMVAEVVQSYEIEYGEIPDRDAER